MQPSPVPSQPPKASQPPRQSHGPRENGRRPLPGSTIEAPLMEGMRKPSMPPSKRNQALKTIQTIIANLGPTLSEVQRSSLAAAAEAAENVPGISPMTEFFARVECGLLGAVSAEYERLRAEGK